jgi:hypothetical protein
MHEGLPVLASLGVWYTKNRIGTLYNYTVNSNGNKNVT